MLGEREKEIEKFGERKTKRKKKEERKQKEEEGEKERKKPTASHSVKGQRHQEHWIGAHWESQKANPLPSIVFRLRSALLVTGVLAVGRVVKNRYVYRAARLGA